MSKKNTISILIILSFLQLSAQDSWIVDKNGCKVHNPYPRKREAVLWTGDCSDSLATGEGKLIWFLNGKKTKNVFEGTMINGKTEGHGTYTFSDGTYLNGTFKDGYFYEGTKVEKIGKSMHTYKGKFADNYLTGYGELTVQDSYHYSGYFIDGVENGDGILIQTDGEEYEGTFKDGYYLNGKLTLKNGLVYIADFDSFQPYYGTILYQDSTRYIGDIKDWVPHGKGTIYLTDGGVFTCTWRKRTAHGQGEYLLPGGVTYKAIWKNGAIEGKGEIIYPDGKTNIGIWKNGVLLEELNGH